MKNIKLFLGCFCFTAFLLSSCRNLPDHAKLIPANAVVAAGVNTKEIGKKIAWNAIIGSKLFDEMKETQPGENKDAFDPEKMGVELMSTSYVYIKADNRFGDGNKVTALIPLEDVAKWETFVKTTFPEASISTNKDHKDAMLADDMYAGWNNDLLIIMNAPGVPVWEEIKYDSTGAAIVPPRTIDNTLLTSEMDNAFHTAKENALTENEKFTKLEKEGHDITLWINYDLLMGEYGSKGMSDMVGLPMSNALWKDAAFTAGFDFEKGKIAGDFRYYMSEELKEVSKAFSKDNIDKEMVDMLPDDELDILIGWHISPQGIKTTLEKMGVLGFINLALTSQNMSADYILEAFTGDMVMSVNNFKLTKKGEMDSVSAESAASSYSSDAKYIYAMKINKQENFDKLLNMALTNNILLQQPDNTYTLATMSSDIAIVVKDKYLVVANSAENANDYISGKYKNKKLPDAIEDIYKNPVGVYLNAQGVMNTVSSATLSAPRDSAMVAESKKLLKDVVFKGGGFKDNAFSYEMNINFLNKEENSLLLLMNFATKINDAQHESLMAIK